MDSFWMANGFVGLPDPIEDTHRKSLLVYLLVTQESLTDDQNIYPLHLLSFLAKLGPNLSTTSPTFLSIHTHFALNDRLPRSPAGPPSLQTLTLHLISMTMIPPCPHSLPAILPKVICLDLTISYANLHRKVCQLTQNCSHPWKWTRKQMRNR